MQIRCHSPITLSCNRPIVDGSQCLLQAHLTRSAIVGRLAEQFEPLGAVHKSAEIDRCRGASPRLKVLGAPSSTANGVTTAATSDCRPCRRSAARAPADPSAAIPFSKTSTYGVKINAPTPMIPKTAPERDASAPSQPTIEPGTESFPGGTNLQPLRRRRLPESPPAASPRRLIASRRELQQRSGPSARRLAPEDGTTSTGTTDAAQQQQQPHPPAGKRWSAAGNGSGYDLGPPSDIVAAAAAGGAKQPASGSAASATFTAALESGTQPAAQVRQRRLSLQGCWIGSQSTPGREPARVDKGLPASCRERAAVGPQVEAKTRRHSGSSSSSGSSSENCSSSDGSGRNSGAANAAAGQPHKQKAAAGLGGSSLAELRSRERRVGRALPAASILLRRTPHVASHGADRSSSSNSFGSSSSSSSYQPGAAGGGSLRRKQPRGAVHLARTALDASGDGGGGGSGGGLGAALGAASAVHSVKAWRLNCTPIDMEAAYPELPSFAAAVRRYAAKWHPLVLSAALNHAAKLSEDLPPGALAAPSGLTGGRGIVIRGAQQRAADDAASVLRQTLDRLHAAFLPFIPSIGSSRYAINALWGCAKTGYWGAPGSSFVSALLDRLRRYQYDLLRKSNGQSHGNLWWALSQYKQRDGTAAAGAAAGEKVAVFWKAGASGSGKTTQGSAAAVAASFGDATTAAVDGRAGAATEAAGAGGSGGVEAAAAGAAGGRQREPLAAGLTAGRGEEKTVTVAAQEDVVLDLLRMSAAVIREQKVLPEDSFKPQEFSNILLGAARLGYASDPRFIDHLLSYMTRHPGPFKPQAIANTVYALGDLYYTDPSVAALPAPAPPEKQVDGGGGKGTPDRGGTGGAESGGGGSACEPGGHLPTAFSGHVRALVGLALRLGLQRFSSQELCNMVHGLARLGLRFDDSRIPSEKDERQHQQEEDPGLGEDEELGEDGEEEEGEGSPQNQQHLRAYTAWEAPKAEEPVAYEGVLAPSTSPSSASDSGSCSTSAVDPQGLDALGANDEAARQFVVRVAEHMRNRIQAQPVSARQRTSLSLGPQTLAVTTWSLAAMCYSDQSYYEAAVHSAIHCGGLEGATSQEWGIFLWGIASQAHQPPGEMLHQLYDRSGRSSPLELDDLQGWRMMLWALAVLDMYDADIISWIVSFVDERRVAALEPLGIANSLWSLAAMPEGAIVRHSGLVALLLEAAERVDPEQFGTVGHFQLWQFHVELEAVLNDQSSTAAAAAAGIPTTDAELPLPASPAPRQRGRRKAKPPPPPPPAVPALRRLSAPLVAAARETLRDSNSGNRRVTFLQASVHRHLQILMKRQQRQLRLQQQQQGGAARGQGRRRALAGTSDSDNATSSDDADDMAPTYQEGSVSDTEVAAAAAVPWQRRGRRLQPSERARSADTRSRTQSDPDSSRPPTASAAAVVICRVEQEWGVEELAMRVDLGVWLSDGRMMVVEVDGPHHFLRNKPRIRMPNTELRDRQLRRVLGRDNVKILPYWEWDLVAGTEAKVTYLSHLLGLL